MKLLFSQRTWPLIVLLLADGLFFSFTNPKSATTAMLMTGFILLILTLYTVIGVILRLSRWYGLTNGKHSRRLVAALTCLAGGLVALQSAGQLQTHDIVVLLPFTLLVYLYLSYGRPGQRVEE